jgi:hypothetical protein
VLSTKEQIQEIQRVLSPCRIATYVAATGSKQDSDPAALNLYIWNAQVSGAFLTPLHICEVALRNAVDDALSAKYGAAWPWSTAFEKSLPNPLSGYNPRHDLSHARQQFQVAQTGKIIPELKFVFWLKMFTGRHDVRIWNQNLFRVFPNLDLSRAVADSRKAIYDALDSIRLLRNRIAHHEPIFNRALADDFKLIEDIIVYRSKNTAQWMSHHQQVVTLLKLRP